MSAAGRSKKAGTGHERDSRDFYGTPDWATRAILPHLSALGCDLVVDPCCGAGAILDVVGKEWPDVACVGLELDDVLAAEARTRGHQVHRRDALDAPSWGKWARWKHPLVLTNPPYKLAIDFVQRAIDEMFDAGGAIVMLLRLNWLASQKRAKWMRQFTPSVHVLPRRPPFTGDGKTDATDYGWMIWQRGRAPTVSILECEGADGETI